MGGLPKTILPDSHKQLRVRTLSVKKKWGYQVLQASNCSTSSRWRSLKRTSVANLNDLLRDPDQPRKYIGPAVLAEMVEIHQTGSFSSFSENFMVPSTKIPPFLNVKSETDCYDRQHYLQYYFSVLYVFTARLRAPRTGHSQEMTNERRTTCLKTSHPNIVQPSMSL